jgi:hypothetical protein
VRKPSSMPSHPGPTEVEHCKPDSEATFLPRDTCIEDRGAEAVPQSKTAAHSHAGSKAYGLSLLRGLRVAECSSRSRCKSHAERQVTVAHKSVVFVPRSVKMSDRVAGQSVSRFPRGSKRDNRVRPCEILGLLICKPLSRTRFSTARIVALALPADTTNCFRCRRFAIGTWIPAGRIMENSAERAYASRHR